MCSSLVSRSIFKITPARVFFSIVRDRGENSNRVRADLRTDGVNKVSESGERTDKAGLCKAQKAKLCEREANPRQPCLSLHKK